MIYRISIPRFFLLRGGTTFPGVPASLPTSCASDTFDIRFTVSILHLCLICHVYIILII